MTAGDKSSNSKDDDDDDDNDDDDDDDWLIQHYSADAVLGTFTHTTLEDKV